LEAHLLEINDYPSLDINLDRAFMGGDPNKKPSKVDSYVKGLALGDAINLTRKPEPLPAAYKSYSLLYP